MSAPVEVSASGVPAARGPDDTGLWARILSVDECSHEYFSERADWPGAVLFTNPGAAPFNLAIIGDVPQADAAGLLDRLVRHYHELGVACRLRLTPLSRPADWPDRLAAGGFRHLEDEDEAFMVHRMAWAGTVAMPAAPVTVRRVEDDAALSEFVLLQQAAWQSPPQDGDRALRLARRSLSAGRYRFYVACLEGRPAGAASARFANGLAGIYGVATLPDLRRQGVGAALVAHIVAAARRMGGDAAFLSAEPGGYAAGLYQRLGFEPLFQVRNYALEAPAATARPHAAG